MSPTKNGASCLPLFPTVTSVPRGLVLTGVPYSPPCLIYLSPSTGSLFSGIATPPQEQPSASENPVPSPQLF